MFRDEGRFACALRALDRGEFADADAAFSELLARDWSAGERAFLINKRGVARIGLDLRDLARADFEEALRLTPSHAPALTNLGNLMLEEGDVDGAIARYERAIAADAQYPVAHWNLSVAYKRTGRRADAVRELRLATRLEQNATASNFWRRVRRQ